MKSLIKFSSPQLKTLHNGKVRDSIRIDKKTRMIVVSDRISAFNKNSQTPIPEKGAILNSITNFWFEKTRHIIDNHFIKQIDPNISLVKEANPIRVEMIVRAYLTGSMWRGYEQGQRVFSGVTVPDGLTKNEAFPTPILTPTTKDKYDTEITEEEIIKRKLVSKKVYQKMKEKALELFQVGSDHLAEQGIILVDTKYEFGLLGKKLILIDEIHTPDSSRFWRAEDYEKNPVKAEQIDKEFVRQWLLKNKKNGQVPDQLPAKVVEETSRRYKDIYQLITGKEFEDTTLDTGVRNYHNVVNEGLIKPGFIAIIMGSTSDLKHCEKIASYLKDYDVAVDFRVTSAHKNGERIEDIATEYNNAIEPVVVIAVAGRSNGLGGALAANLNIPVINCPPFSDKADLHINVFSSIMMPSSTPAMTVIHPDNAAKAALRALNIPSIRAQLSEDIKAIKTKLIEDDNKLRNSL